MAEHDQFSLVRADAADILGRVIGARHSRDRLFGEELFADPAWDILLELSHAHLQRRTVTITHLLKHISASESTLLRWLEKLEQEGWMRRLTDTPGPAPLELSPKGVAAMQKWISALAREPWPGGDPITSLLERIDRGRRDP